MFNPIIPPPIIPIIPPPIIPPPPIPPRRWARASISSMKMMQPPHTFALRRAERTIRYTLIASMPMNNMANDPPLAT